jgi:hypothetical protein
MSDYLKTVAELILQNLKDGLGEAWSIESFYNGDPGIFPIGALPAICVVKQIGKVTQDSTQRDNMDSTYMIKVILSKEEDYNASPTEDLTQSRLERIVESRDYTTGYYIASSLMGVLRQNFTLENRVVDNKIDIRYGITQRGETLYAEANVQINLSERIDMYGART